MPMTEDQFFAALAGTARMGMWNAEDVDGKRLRLRGRRLDILNGLFCPLTAVARDMLGTDYFTFQWEVAAEALGLDRVFAQSIMMAADGDESALRDKLIATCLPERAP